VRHITVPASISCAGHANFSYDYDDRGPFNRIGVMEVCGRAPGIYTCTGTYTCKAAAGVQRFLVKWMGQHKRPSSVHLLCNSKNR